MQDDIFYRAFEDRHRGSRELIKDRLAVYIPFIKPLRDIYDTCSVFDLGCGRGEWLELLVEAGFKAHGIDLDEGMLAACRERLFSVEAQDAIEALRALPDESQTVISGFHIAEHIPFESLKIFVKEALRTLKPAGLLILETPNPENIIVATSNFYLDPTHQRPIPPQLLSFLPEQAGFFRTKILRLQEPSDLATSRNINLLNVLNGVSPDYSVVAQKNAQADHISKFDSVFEKNYGLTLETLAQRYESGIHRKFAELEGKLDLIEATTQESLRFADQLSQLNTALFSALSDLKAQADRAQHWQAQAEQLQIELAHRVHDLQAVYASKSWRVTRPLRLGLHSLRWLLGRAKN
ncbi:MAG: methyltransferase domain-containing protein [Proteobacteria bacterium]|nr:methyltransferase domain-containing protein [Pseudomonadota bacterium]